MKPRTALVALLALSCSDASGPSDGVVERRIAPSATDLAITRWTADHYVWFVPSSSTAGQQLMLLLPGTGGAPQGFKLIGHVAANQGYRAIGLMYADDIAVISVCTDPADTQCMSDMRSEIIEGDDRSPYVEVDPANSITGRLVSLLRHLADRYPAEGWDAFLDGDAPRWSTIAVGGLSQGGGHAAFIARLRAVPRVVMFGSPTDGFDGAPAPWMTIRATPVERYYGLVHMRDPFPSIVPNWRALGMDTFGDLTVVEASAPPFDGSHMLTTDLLPATGSYSAAHASVFADGATPRLSDGSAVLAPVWRYMLGEPGASGEVVGGR